MSGLGSGSRSWPADVVTFIGMSPDTMWIIGTVVTVGAALAGFMYALVGGVNNTVSTGLASVNKRIDDVRVDLQRLHDDHDRLEERLRAVGA